MAETCASNVLVKKSCIRKLLVVLIAVQSSLGLAQPPEPIATGKGNIEPGYFFMVPFKMSNRHETPFSYLMILNEKAELVYYRKVKAASDFKIQNNGQITYFAKDKFYIFDKTLTLLDSVGCVNGAGTDAHDFLVLKNGHFLLMGWEIVTENCSGKRMFMNSVRPGSKRAHVKYGVIQELDQNKKLVYEWKSRNAFSLEKADPYFLNDTLNVDLTHFNSVDIDAEGNVMVSARYYNEVFKVNRKTGKMMWRFGGKNNTMKLINDAVPFFGQHDAKFVGSNRITIYDNGYTSPENRHNARALEYEIDDKAGTAKRVWKYENNSYTVSKGTGNTQKLPNGNVLVNYGQVEKGKPNISFELVNNQGGKLISVHFKDTVGTYRAFFYAKKQWPLTSCRLIKSGTGARTFLQPEGHYKYYRWNTGETTEKISPATPGQFYVYVSNDGLTFTRSEKYVLR